VKCIRLVATMCEKVTKMDTGQVDTRVWSGRIAGQIQDKFSGSGKVGS